MTNSIDAQLMKMADNHSKVSGTYFGVSFTGVATKSRQHSVNNGEMLMIKLDSEIMKPGNFMSDGDIILCSWDIENGLHTVEEVK
jgi:hypothetical protein